MASFAYDGVTNAALELCVSPERLAVYLQATANHRQAALDLYIWNLTLSAAFYGPLGIFEITLRNALHREISVLYGPDCPNDPEFLTMAKTVRNPRPIQPPLNSKDSNRSA